MRVMTNSIGTAAELLQHAADHMVLVAAIYAILREKGYKLCDANVKIQMMEDCEELLETFVSANGLTLETENYTHDGMECRKTGTEYKGIDVFVYESQPMPAVDAELEISCWENSSR